VLIGIHLRNIMSTVVTVNRLITSRLDYADPVGTATGLVVPPLGGLGLSS